MSSNDIVLKFISAFDELGILYMLVGSYSSNLYGRPRSTQDADFVLQCPDSAIGLLRTKLGRAYKLAPQMSFESVTGTMRYIVEHPASAFKVELFFLSDDPHDKARFERKQQEDFEGHQVWLPSPEDVVVTKLRWSKSGQRQKDTDDVSQVLAVQAGKLDLAYIRSWCDQHGTRELFERLLKESLEEG